MRTRSRVFKTALMVVTLGATGALLVSGSANASQTTDGSAGSAAVAKNPEVVFVAPASSSTATSFSTARSSDGATFYPTGPIGTDTLVVMPDIYEAAGLTYKDVAQIHTLVGMKEALSANSATTCGATVTGIYGTWSSPVSSSCSVWGTDWSVHVYYSWNVATGTYQSAAAMGLGFYQGYNGSQFGVWSQYYGLGVGASGGASVPWGNVASHPKVKAQSMIISSIAQVTFTH
jgi:hypothetical protein